VFGAEAAEPRSALSSRIYGSFLSFMFSKVGVEVVLKWVLK
jgi:hypothetical protein